jgi:hypothetical protein
MGLDMYLDAKTNFWAHEKEGKIIGKIRKIFPEIYEKTEMVSISFNVGYWRKANHIHGWFVENIQEGNDDCREYYVDRDSLMKLKKLCEEVIKKAKIIDGTIDAGLVITPESETQLVNVGEVIKNSDEIAELLPTKSGLFFGSQDYDEWYVRKTKETIEIIDRCLKLPDNWHFYYQSSW